MHWQAPETTSKKIPIWNKSEWLRSAGAVNMPYRRINKLIKNLGSAICVSRKSAKFSEMFFENPWTAASVNQVSAD